MIEYIFVTREKNSNFSIMNNERLSGWELEYFFDIGLSLPDDNDDDDDDDGWLVIYNKNITTNGP